MPAIRKLVTRRQRQSRFDKRPTTMRDAVSQLFPQIKNDTPVPSPQFDRVPLPRGFVRTPEPASAKDARSLPTIQRGENIGNDDEDMTLGQIENFTMRSEVAKLMAVAPGLPVRDLYHLIIDSKG
jgi:hypothetical protein